MTVVLVSFDLYLDFDNIKGNTYSERIREWASTYTALPYLLAAVFGALLTHWFARRDAQEKQTPKRLIVFVSILLFVFLGMVGGLFW